jgi:hypothetical protein
VTPKRAQMAKIQADMGLPVEQQDGIVGAITRAAFEGLALDIRAEAKAGPTGTPGVLPAWPGWKFSASLDEDDIVMRNVTATWFGGVDDPLDNGETSSGVSTRDPDVLGCALAVVSRHPSTKGAPLAFPAPGLKPGIPWKTDVEISYQGKSITVPLLDNGPAQSAGDAIDLTQAVFKFFGVSLKVGILHGVNVRIIGAAKYAKGATE